MDETTENEVLLPFEREGGSRRSFLQLVGFGIAGASLAGCSRGPTRRAIPALEASREFVPGRPYWIASTCGGCEAGCGVLARCRDGRPIKLEGTPAHPISSGGLCPSGQGSVLSLYDSHRFDGPRRRVEGGEESVTWQEADAELRALLEQVRASGGRVRLLTGTIHGPSTKATIAEFVGSFADARHITYDGLSTSAIGAAHEATHGERLVPTYRFERAKTIVAFDADFLGTWISPVEFAAGYTAARDLEADGTRMSRHHHLEARTSLTGCRADVRTRLAPWEVGPALSALCGRLERLAGKPGPCAGVAEVDGHGERIASMATELWEHRGESLVIAGSDESSIQVLANYANELLGNYGSTVDLAEDSRQCSGDDRQLEALQAELVEGEVDLLIVAGANPAHTLGGTLDVGRATHLVSCATVPDETSALADWVLPEPHFLESWDDAQPRRGTYCLTQPTVPALRPGRTLRATLAALGGDSRTDRELLREYWREELFPRTAETDFDTFFDGALHEGFVILGEERVAPRRFVMAAVRPVAGAVAPVAGALDLVLYPKVGMLDGRHAHNPWLHELPDPVSKITWDNYACLSPKTAERLGLDEGDVVDVSPTDSDASIRLPVHIQRGQHDGVVAVALGYGREGTQRFTDVGPQWLEGRPTVEPGSLVGARAEALIADPAGRRGSTRHVTVAATGAATELAATQDHHSLVLPEHLAIEGHERRDLARTTSFAAWKEDPGAVAHGHHLPATDLWQDDHAGDTTWGLAIDLAKCTGCSACVVACQAENNVPVVGRDEVQRHREMSWLRIDRYFEGEEDDLRALHQPMMCQQCDHAPCESVCPVLATVHSSEGLNQQVYNRCVGTRYCANTCPYKTRRFNWFNYPREDALQNHALNPDVTIRSRGVMEKCSFCLQRIQEAKAEAKREGRELRDGDITPACQQSCPAGAIVFGNLRDPESRVAALAARPRAYAMLEELNVQPSVRYLAHVHNGRREEGHRAH
jgi:molybdopterin-containing oxidoreductase family iron-sulfur binding subunit